MYWCLSLFTIIAKNKNQIKNRCTLNLHWLPHLVLDVTSCGHCDSSLYWISCDISIKTDPIKSNSDYQRTSQNGLVGWLVGRHRDKNKIRKMQSVNKFVTSFSLLNTFMYINILYKSHLFQLQSHANSFQGTSTAYV